MNVFPHILHCSSSSSSSSLSRGVSCCFSSNNIRKQKEMIKGRDMVIDFGKHKGKMLGTLSCEYLRWMSKNLNIGEWGKLAEEVLEDEIYADRMEWEVAERLLSGGGIMGCGGGVARELEEISKRFGWDYNDKVGWSKVDFKLLGTSKGGRLPRRIHEERKPVFDNKPKQQVGGIGNERLKRRERKRSREQQKKMLSSTSMNDDKDDDKEEMTMNNETTAAAAAAAGGVNEKSFPGREYLIKKLFIDDDT